MNLEAISDQEQHLKEQILECGKVPRHVAVIMDGNGRWAKQRGLSRVEGHKEGINSVRDIVRAAAGIGVEYLTLYTFSAENWKRPKGEVSALMKLLLHTIHREVAELNRNNVRLMTIGHLQDLPFLPRRGMQQAMEVLRKNTGMTLNLALSYSGRQEILDAVAKLAQSIAAGDRTVDSLTEADFSAHLYTAALPDPELLIRTSGEQRISNFLLWQLAYTEIYITGKYWPEFRTEEFYEAIRVFQGRERRFGQLSEQLQK